MEVASLVKIGPPRGVLPPDQNETVFGYALAVEQDNGTDRLTRDAVSGF